ncbi:diguanylate cyclase/phosphodiesterase [Aliiroseovarius halocynthiae]|uniref:GGDEF domain-containing protein n=1 Tax=Aliiroseovarius halocynthiae TaxID=985055 RepID=A0A545SXU7_9RHOB|nr:bifunctional diguanylate cyclase/phosphodiesterase [Aliiroseovarius halocynthiae]TQV69784.1 GGDEF domain-containing protein [Aliiroseovarius halocynthiae]SMR81756.1 diguanylate cyclase/phosphodiesterase [Aliiroseovarius halocynthiae]
MAASFGQKTFKFAVRNALTSPQLTALLPAAMLLAYWWGGETGLLYSAVIFPGLFVLCGALTRTSQKDRWPTDGVTGLPMRGRLTKMLDAGFHDPEIKEKTCLVIEVDAFPKLADHYGVDAQERVEADLGETLRTMLRVTDLICSLGRGRFGIAIDRATRADLEVVLQIATRLQSAIMTPIELNETRLHLTASVGFALPQRAPEASGNSLLQAAESALQTAQAAGPGSIRAFSNGMAPRAAASEHSEAELSEALDAGQMVPWFQPQVCLRTGRLTGMEALVRWNHPKLGWIAPGAFLPALTQAGLLERLSEVMLFECLSSINDWDQQGLDVPKVSVNLSSAELSNPKLFEKIRWDLDRFDVSPERLTLEILESVIAQSEDDVIARNINALARMGCGIDLDDFGTGHASIAHIRRFTLNRIKIDRSFITHVDTDPNQQNMVSAILTMANQLEIGALAEGVETHGEYTKLGELGCTDVQGYAVAKPMPMDATCLWIRNHKSASSRIQPVPKHA